MKIFALLAVSIASLNAVPASFGVAYQSYKQANKSEYELYEQDNGDYSAIGYGSVSEELKQYGVDVISYNAGLGTSSRPLLISESNNAVYIYTYDLNSSLNYDKISISFDTTINDSGFVDIDIDPNFLTYDIMPVSTSSTKRLTKWKIENYTPDLSKSHIYYARELINSATNDIFPAVMTYQYNADTKEFKCDLENYVEITNKQVAWQLIPTNDGLKQLHYVIFNTSIDEQIDYLTKIELSYKANYIGGITDLEADQKGYNSDVITAYNFKNKFSRLSISEPINNGQEIKVQVEPERKIYTYNSQFWIWKQNETWIVDTLTTIDELLELNPEQVLSNVDVSGYKWFVNFREDEMSASVPSNTQTYYSDTGLSQLIYNFYDRYVIGLKNDQVGKYFGDPLDMSGYYTDFERVEDRNNYTTDNMAVDVNDLTILRLWFYYQGEEHEAIAVDTYTTSQGTGNILDPDVMTFQDWLAKVQAWWQKWWTAIVAVIAGVILLPIIVTFFPTVLTILKFVITAPFKIVKWLFSCKRSFKN